MEEEVRLSQDNTEEAEIERPQRDIIKSYLEWLKRRWDTFVEHKGQFPFADPKGEFDAVLGFTAYTPAFQDLLRDYATRLETPDEAFKFLMVDLNHDQLGLFEPGSEHDQEKVFLGGLLNEAAEGLGVNRAPSISSFPAMLSEAAKPLPFMIRWGHEFREAYRDDSFIQEVDALRTYLPLLGKDFN